MNKVKISAGWSVVDLTPPCKVPTGGYPDSRLGHWTHDPIRATALALQPEGGELVIWVSIDTVGIFSHHTEDIARLVAEQIPGFKRENLIISATHQHTAPIYDFVYAEYLDIMPDAYEEFTRRMHEQGAISPSEYREQYFYPLMTKVCVDAASNLAPAGFAPALGHAVIGHCRRVRYKDGTSKMYGETDSENFDRIEGGEDSGVEFLYVYDDKDEISGVVVMVHCPSQAAETEPFYTADYFGAFRMQLNEQMGREVPVLALCGFAGDQAPRDLPRYKKSFSTLKDNHCGIWMRRDGSDSLKQTPEPNMWSWEGSYELGRRLLVAFNETKDRAAANIEREVEFAHVFREEKLQIRTVTEKEAMASKAYLDNAISSFEGSVYDAFLHLECEFLAEPAAPYRRWQWQRKTTVYRTPVHCLRLGKCAFATNPFEIYLAYAQRMKARVRADHVFTVQLTDDCGFYLPTEDAEAAGGYSANIHSQKVRACEGSHLTEVCINQLNEFWDE